MNPTWKILAPIDLTRTPEADIDRAASVAASLNADLHLVYVAKSDAVAPGWPDGDSSRLRNQDVNVHRAVLRGTAITALNTYAAFADVDLVMMTSQDYGKWSSGFWRKSTTEGILRDSDLPVYIDRGGPRPGRSGHILCVVGLDGREAAMIRNAEELADRMDAKLVLLNVVPVPGEGLLYDAIDGGSRPLSKARATIEIDRLAQSLRRPATTLVMVGDPKRRIREAAQQFNADLVIVARSRGAVPAVYDSSLKGLARKLDCPLVTVPASPWSAVPRIDVVRLDVRYEPDVAEASTMQTETEQVAGQVARN